MLRFRILGGSFRGRHAILSSARRYSALQDPYAILGLRPGASEAEVKKAYRKKAMELHPDRNQSKEAELEFRRATEAHDVLTDPSARAKFEASRRGFGTPGWPPGSPPPGWTPGRSAAGGPPPGWTPLGRMSLRDLEKLTPKDIEAFMARQGAAANAGSKTEEVVTEAAPNGGKRRILRRTIRRVKRDGTVEEYNIDTKID